MPVSKFFLFCFFLQGFIQMSAASEASIVSKMKVLNALLGGILCLLLLLIFMISGIALPKYTREAGNAWDSEFYLSMHARHVTNTRKDNVKMW